MARLRYNLPSDRFVSPMTMTLSTGTAMTGYPVTNLIGANPAFPFKWSAATGRINFDCGSAKAVNLVALVHHNFDAGLALKWEAGATLGASTFSQAFTVAAKDTDGYRPNTFLDLSAAPPNYRYHSLKVEGTNAASVILGLVWIGLATRTVVNNYGWDYKRNDMRPGASTWNTKAGVRWRYPSIGRQRRLEGQIDTTDAGAAAISTWQQASGGTDQPMIVIPDAADITDAMLAYWDTDFQFAQPFTNTPNLPVAWLECARGIPWT